MAKMRIALLADRFAALHEMTIVLHFADLVGIDRLPEARPAGARFILRLGGEKRLAAADAVIGSGFLVMVVAAGERALGAFPAGDRIFLGRELGPPFRVGFRDFFTHLLILFRAPRAGSGRPFLNISRAGDFLNT